MTTHRFTISEDTAHVRLDVFLTQQLEEAPSREFVKKLITGGKVLVNGQPVKSNHKLLAGEEVVAAIVDEDFPDERILPEPMTLDIVYEDAWVAVINKPSGLTVHPASGHYGGTLINGLMHHFQQLSDVNGDRALSIVSTKKLPASLSLPKITGPTCVSRGNLKSIACESNISRWCAVISSLMRGSLTHPSARMTIITIIGGWYLTELGGRRLRGMLCAGG
jgi:ribosomal 50S subunit-recycling heat shock protein